MVIVSVVLCLDLFQLFYRNPRPFWVSSNIKGYSCETDYGNPNDAMILIGALVTVLVTGGIDKFDKTDDQVNVDKPRRTCGKTIGLVACISFGVLFILGLQLLIAFSQMVIGVASIDQVSYGWILGVWIGCFFHFCLRDALF